HLLLGFLDFQESGRHDVSRPADEPQPRARLQNFACSACCVPCWCSRHYPYPLSSTQERWASPFWLNLRASTLCSPYGRAAACKFARNPIEFTRSVLIP